MNTERAHVVYSYILNIYLHTIGLQLAVSNENILNKIRLNGDCLNYTGTPDT